MAVLGSPGAMRAEGYLEEARHARALLVAPLEQLLEAGLRDGTFPLADPVADAPNVQAVTWAAALVNPMREATASSRAEARRSVRSFCLRALGAES